MNTGIIMIGLALVLFSVALMVSPSQAAVPGNASPDSGGSPAVQDQVAGQETAGSAAPSPAGMPGGTTGSGSCCLFRYPR